MSRRLALGLVTLMTTSLSAQARTGQLDRVPAVAYGEQEAVPLARITSGVLLGDTIVVSDGGTVSLRFFGPSGQQVRQVGRAGEGPGEFTRIDWVQARGDRLYVMDSGNQRLTVLTRGGAMREMIDLRGQAGLRTQVLGIFGDRSMLGQQYVVRVPVAVRVPTVRRDSSGLTRLDTLAHRADSLGWFLRGEQYREPYGNGGESISPAVFGRTTVIGVGIDRYYVLDNTTPLVRVFTTAGKPLAALQPRTGIAEERVTPADLAAARSQLTADPRFAGEMAAQFDRKPKPATLPFFGWGGKGFLFAMTVGSTGDVWVLHYGGVRDRAAHWSVFTPAGALRGEVAASSGVRLLDVTGDRALVIRLDDDDVEHVEVRRVRW